MRWKVFFIVLYLGLSYDCFSQIISPLGQPLDVNIDEIPPSPGFIGGSYKFNSYVLAKQTNQWETFPKFVMTNLTMKKVVIVVYVNKTGEPIKYEIREPIENCFFCTFEALEIIKSIPLFVAPQGKFKNIKYYVFRITYRI